MTHVVIQHIRIVWTKKTRGGDGARVRNRLPKTHRLPSIVSSSPFVLHQVNYSEWRDFTLVEQLKSSGRFEDLGLQNIELVQETDELIVRFFRDSYNVAKPQTKPQFTDVFRLAESEWGQLTYNGRYVDFDTGDWWYEKSVHNIAFSNDQRTNLFTKSKPDHCFSELQYLR